METGDLLDALPREHENAHGARVRRVNWRVRAFEPAVEADELLFIKPARPDFLGLRGNAGSGIVNKTEAPLRHSTIIVLRFQTPAVRGSDVAPDVIRHRTLAAIIDGPDNIGDFVRLDVPSWPIAAERIGDSVKDFLGFLPG